MKRIIHICLLLAAFAGLIGQSAGMAMGPGPMRDGSMQVSISGMDSMDMANAPAPGTSPCKKMTLQCIAAMGCAPSALVAPATAAIASPVVERDKSAPSLMARLLGRSYGPEPDPPSFLI